jgi:hypothetical protein
MKILIFLLSFTFFATLANAQGMKGTSSAGDLVCTTQIHSDKGAGPMDISRIWAGGFKGAGAFIGENQTELRFYIYDTFQSSPSDKGVHVQMSGYVQGYAAGSVNLRVVKNAINEPYQMYVTDGNNQSAPQAIFSFGSEIEKSASYDLSVGSKFVVSCHVATDRN